MEHEHGAFKVNRARPARAVKKWLEIHRAPLEADACVVLRVLKLHAGFLAKGHLLPNN
jgi:hypothetical protein